MPEPKLLERELAREKLQEELATSEKASHCLRMGTISYEEELRCLGMGTISYEEALERELEYRKQVKRTFSQHLAATCLQPLPLHELPSAASFIGTKRKMASGILQDPVPQREHTPELPQRGLQVPPQITQMQQPTPRPLEDHQASKQCQNPSPPMPSPSSHRSEHRSPSQQLSQSQLSLQGPTQSRQLMPQQLYNQQGGSQIQYSPFWCSLCRVNCSNAFHLKQHYRGKVHRRRSYLIFGNKNTTQRDQNHQMLWCKVCNVPCSNEMALVDHNSGKKHAARILALKAKEGTSCAMA